MTNPNDPQDPEWILEVRRWLQLVKKLAQRKEKKK